MDQFFADIKQKKSNKNTGQGFNTMMTILVMMMTLRIKGRMEEKTVKEKKKA